MKVVRQKGTGVALHDRKLAALCQAPLARRATIVDAIVEHVMLLAIDTGNAGPGRVVVGRLLLANRARRSVQRKTPVRVLGEVKYRSSAARQITEALRREQVRPGGERNQHGLDVFEHFPTHPMPRLDGAHGFNGLAHGLCATVSARLIDRHTALLWGCRQSTIHSLGGEHGISRKMV